MSDYETHGESSAAAIGYRALPGPYFDGRLLEVVLEDILRAYGKMYEYVRSVLTKCSK